MSLENLIPTAITVNILGKEYKVNFNIRNFAALKSIHNISENQLLKGLTEYEWSMIPFAIWTSTLVFDHFTIENPLKIKEQLNLEDLFNLSLAETNKIIPKLVEAMSNSLPQADKTVEAGKAAEKKLTKKT